MDKTKSFFKVFTVSLVLCVLFGTTVYASDESVCIEDEQVIEGTDSFSDDPVEGLDVSILQQNVLGPILGIGDPKTDKRIDFVGGIRGLSELEKRCHEDMKIAFSMHPTSIAELINVADAGLLMPPKSTWFEPKLLSGLFIHGINGTLR